MAGAEFIRADLHVHTHPDSELSPEPDLDAYVAAAIASGVGVLAITDHNAVAFVRDAIDAAARTDLLVLPGIEISTHDGHLLALFDPGALGEFERFTNPQNLRLTDISEPERRSHRAMLDLVAEIDESGGLAIPAHVDAANGIQDKLGHAELTDLLTSPALAGLEFATHEALTQWFSETDPDSARQAAWRARQSDPELRERGLARLMSSDAHSVEKVGEDRTTRTLTRLRLDYRSFDAVRLAVKLNPKARCKAEVVLPASYPRLLSARFSGGFLDGVDLDFTANLNCVIGGRGSGKSTALLAIRAALGARLSPDDDPDEAPRMPDETRVRFIDGAGSERIAVRRRGETPVDEQTGSPIRLRVADLGQDESGRLARGYEDDPGTLLAFLDDFVVLHDYEEREDELLAELEDNESEVRRTSGFAKQLETLEAERAQLDASLSAAQEGKVELIAQWAALLAAHTPLLARLDERITEATKILDEATPVDVDALANEFGVDVTKVPAKAVLDGPDGLRNRLTTFYEQRSAERERSAVALREAAEGVRERVDEWRAERDALEEKRRAKQAELEAEGLQVQAGVVQKLAARLQTVKTQLADLTKRRDQHKEARKARKTLLADLRSNRDARFEARKATLKRISHSANEHSDGLEIRVFFERGGMQDAWIAWLTKTFGFRSPRVQRLASKISPDGFAEALLTDRALLLALRDESGEAFFDEEMLESAREWSTIFYLETLRLEDRPRIGIQEPGGTQKPFDQLSAGQQRSVLLSLLLCAERSEPLVLDQPEDHLDAAYLASAVVRHLEAAKERRQVLLATHSPNLTVLGDAELVIPMHVEDGHGRPHEVGAVDRPATRDRVCELLEGGVDAYRKRGERYGFQFKTAPDAG